MTDEVTMTETIPAKKSRARTKTDEVIETGPSPISEVSEPLLTWRALETEAYRDFIKAQSEFGSVVKRSTNPAFKSKYADLNSVLDAAVPVLNENNLFLSQPVVTTYPYGVAQTEVQTIIRHANGVIVIDGSSPVIAKDAADPQKWGGGVTYIRRYTLLSALGLAPEDDDGNAAARPATRTTNNPPPSPLDTLKERLKAKGATKEKLPTFFNDRFNGRITKFTELTPAEIDAWNADLADGVPF